MLVVRLCGYLGNVFVMTFLCLLAVCGCVCVYCWYDRFCFLFVDVEVGFTI